MDENEAKEQIKKLSGQLARLAKAAMSYRDISDPLVVE